MQETNPAPAGRTLIAERLPLTSTTFRATGCSTTRSGTSGWMTGHQDDYSAHRTTGKLLDFPYLSLSTTTIYHYLSLSITKKRISWDMHRKTMEDRGRPDVFTQFWCLLQVRALHPGLRQRLVIHGDQLQSPKPPGLHRFS